MKLDKDKLQQILNEELKNVVNEQFPHISPPATKMYHDPELPSPMQGLGMGVTQEPSPVTAPIKPPTAKKKKKGRWVKAPAKYLRNIANDFNNRLQLRWGHQGPVVAELQKMLKPLGFYKGTIDGKFGKGTRSAVFAFQKSLDDPSMTGMAPDGIVGFNTAWDLLDIMRKKWKEIDQSHYKQYKHKQNIDTARRWGPEPEKQYYKENQSNLTKPKLQQIIKEELKSVLNEALPAGWIRSPERRKFYQQWIKDPQKSRWGVGGRKYNDAEVAAAAQWTKSQQPAAKATKSALPPNELHPPPESRGTETPKPVPPAKKKGRWAAAGTKSLANAAKGKGQLRWGHKGPAVEELQKILGVKVDGKFGRGTLRRLKAFQTEYGLKPVDGIVGPETATVLGFSDQKKTQIKQLMKDIELGKSEPKPHSGGAADGAQARAEFNKGMSLINADQPTLKGLEAGIAALERANAIKPHPDTEFNIALAQTKRWKTVLFQLKQQGAKAAPQKSVSQKAAKDREDRGRSTYGASKYY